jgi:poly-gamma-glutamate capsule biosynthesis protein CapA/YwtB (metallophosphatase superfamily)
MIKISFVGDICLDQSAQQLITSKKESLLFGDTREIFSQSDLLVGNLESPITLFEDPIRKFGPNLKANPLVIDALKNVGFDILCLANNHILDYGEVGLLDTISSCNKHGISTLGAGVNLENARKPLIKTINDKKIGFINACEIEFSTASSNSPGANPIDLINLYNDIWNSRSIVDFLILILHGGNEYSSLPNPSFKRQCRFFIDLGVDAVICHHSHVIGPVEIYKNAPIFYSLGNFIFKRSSKPESWNTGLICQLILENDKIDWKIVPFKQNDKTQSIDIITGKKSDMIVDMMKLSNSENENDIKINAQWDFFCQHNERMYLRHIFGINRFHRILFRFKFFNFLLYSNKQQLRMYNMIACDAHRSAILNILDKKIKKL